MKKRQSQTWQWIATYLKLAQFQQFVLPHLVIGRRGPAPSLSLHAIFNHQLAAGYFSCRICLEPAAGCCFREEACHGLKSDRFGGRNGAKPAMAMDSHAFEPGAVRTICLAPPGREASRSSTQTGFACHLQLPPAAAVPGLSVEGTAYRHRPGRLPRNSLHAHLPDVSALAGAGLL